jgi:hypothetical protein
MMGEEERVCRGQKLGETRSGPAEVDDEAHVRREAFHEVEVKRKQRVVPLADR